MQRNLEHQLFRYRKQARPKTGLYEALKPLYIIISILGLFPLSIKYDIINNAFSVNPRSLYANSACALTTIVTVCVFFAVHIDMIINIGKSYSYSEGLSTQVNYILELFLLIIFFLAAYATAFMHKDNYVKILNRSLKAAKRLSKISTMDVYKEVHSKVRIHCLWTLAVILLVHLIVNVTRDDGWWKIFLVTISFVLPQMMQFLLLAFMYTMLQLPAVIFRIIYLTIYNYNKNAELLLEQKDRELNYRLPLNDMRRLHSEAFEILRNINKAFEAPVFLTIIGCFHSIISEAYTLYFGVYNMNLSLHNLVNVFIWIFWQILKVFILGFIGNDLKVKAKRVGENLHNVVLEKDDTRQLAELELFSLQTILQRAELTVYGYFPLDSKLLCNMVGIASMYFIILVQFDQDDVIELKKANVTKTMS